MRGSLDSDLVNRVCFARVRKQQHREVVGSGGTCCILTLRFLLANLNRPLTDGTEQPRGGQTPGAHRDLHVCSALTFTAARSPAPFHLPPLSLEIRVILDSDDRNLISISSLRNTFEPKIEPYTYTEDEIKRSSIIVAQGP